MAQGVKQDISNGLSRRRFLATGAAGLVAACAGGVSRTTARPLYIDGLSFFPETAEEIAASGLDAFICDVSEVESVTDAQGHPRYLRTFDACDRGIDAALDRMRTTFPNTWLATKGSDIGSKPGAGVFFQLQSCEPIDNDLDRIAYFHGRGLRILQLTHHNNNLFAGGAIEAHQSGLTALGRDGIAEMNRLNIIPDVSHASEPTALEAAAQSQSPIILSHGACRAFVDNPRCATDDMIRAVAETGGVMGVFMMSFWLTNDPVPTIDHYIDHIRHVVNVGGIDAAAIANDYPITGQENLRKLGNDNAEGVKTYHGWWRSIHEQGVPGFATLPDHVVIPELNNVYRMQTIHQSLERAGFKAREVEKIMGGNWQRVLVDVLG